MFTVRNTAPIAQKRTGRKPPRSGLTDNAHLQPFTSANVAPQSGRRFNDRLFSIAGVSADWLPSVMAISASPRRWALGAVMAGSISISFVNFHMMAWVGGVGTHASPPVRLALWIMLLGGPITCLCALWRPRIAVVPAALQLAVFTYIVVTPPA